MRIFSGFEIICFPSVYGNNLWQLCIAGKECEMDWVEPERFCCWGNTLCPAKKNVKIHMRSNCHSPSLIPSPDSLHLKSRNYMPAKKGGRNWKHGKRSILIKVRSEVKFKDNMQRDALFRGVPFCRSNEEERFVPWGYFSHLRWIGVLPTRSCSVRRVLRRTSRNQGCPCFTVPLRCKGVRYLNTLLEG